MTNDDLIRVVREKSKEGKNPTEIVNELLSSGHSPEEITAAFNSAASSPREISPQSPNYSPAHLSGPFSLLKSAWWLYRKHFKTFFTIQLVPTLAILLTFGVVTVALGGFLKGAILSSSWLLILGIIAFFAAVIILPFWSTLALFYAIRESGENIGVVLSFKKAWRKIVPSIWANMLLGITIAGGFVLFLIPGFLFMTWFAFALLLVITEDLRGMNALLKSREYVRGRFWPVLFRILFPILIFVLFAFILQTPFTLYLDPDTADTAGRLVFTIIGIFLGPLFLSYHFFLYENLKSLKGDIPFNPKRSTKAMVIGTGLLGIFILTIPFILFIYFTLNLR